MQRLHAAALRWNLRVLDALVIGCTFLLVTLAREELGTIWRVDLVPGNRILKEVSFANQWHLGVLAVPSWLAALQFAGAYEDLRRLRSDQLFLKIFRSVAMAAFLLLGVLFLLQPEAPTSRSLVVSFSLTSVATLFLARRWHHRRDARRDARPYPILLVGSATEAVPLIDAIARRRDWGLRIVGILRGSPLDHTDPGAVAAARPVAGTAALPEVPVLGTLADLPQVLARENVAQVFMTGRAWDTRTLRSVADACAEVGVTFSMDANFVGLETTRAEVQDFEGWSVLSFSSTPTDADALVAKRAIDLLGAAAALVVSAPVLLAVAVAIKLEDGGPIFFAQERSGLYGRPFRMLKFRSMVIDAEARQRELETQNEMSGPVFKMARDPRITRVGAFLRKTSLDEFPQFWNVLRGEMSLVGPRPPLPAEVARYARWQMRRLSMKPGITCIWQVSGRNNVDFDTWMKLDLQYIDSWSLFLDVKLLLRTIPAVLSGRGAR